MACVALPNASVLAQSGSTCTTRCDTQFGVCQAAAEAKLDECLDRAQNAREKALCAVAFTKLEDACRATESSCLSNCPAD
jgi:hypothetical protein